MNQNWINPEEKDPAYICTMASGKVVLCNMQFLSGYCILAAVPQAASINALDDTARAAFMLDMVSVGDALMAVTGAYRINYAVLGNSDPCLHAHIIPRYADEAEELRKGLPWWHPEIFDNAIPFEIQRDVWLIQALRGQLIKK